MSIIYNLDVRSCELLKQLLYEDQYVTVQQLAEGKGISKRSVYYDIQKINEWLQAQNLQELKIERKKGILISKEQRAIIRKKLKAIPQRIAYVFTPAERRKIIVCSILCRSEKLHIDDFIKYCQVSRNTTINDIKQATKEIAKFQLDLIYEKEKGYCIQGDFVKKRSVFFMYFSSLVDFYKKGILSFSKPEEVEMIFGKLKEIESELKAQYVTGILYSIAVFFSTIENRTEKVRFSDEEKNEISVSKEYQLVCNKFSDFDESEKLYLALHLLGSRMQSTSMNFSIKETKPETLRLSKILVKAFSRVACVSFNREDELVQAIAAHLRTSLYRYRYGIQIGNPMLDDIKNEYGDLFKLTTRACKYLEREIGVPIPEGEIAYITLHFGAYITSGRKRKEQELKVLVVCPNGLSTANMIRGEVSTLVPNAKTVDIVSLKDYTPDHNYNVVISTIEIEEEENQVIVHPILTDNDRITILKKCMKYENSDNIYIDHIINIAKKYISEEKLQDFKAEITDYFLNTTLSSYKRKKNYGEGILETLELKHIHIFSKKMNWKESIRISSMSLLEEGFIGQAYIDNMIKKTEKMGPYMFITDNTVLAHADISEGSNIMGLSLNVFKKPVEFRTKDNQIKNAEIIMVLSAEDQVKHIKILNDIMTIFKNQTNIVNILKCRNEKDIKKLISEILQDNDQL